MGMEDRRIPGGALSASSSWNSNHGPQCGRLNRPRGGGCVGAWCARHYNKNQWIQVNFGSLATVTGIATQGRQDHPQWVTSYAVSHSRDGRRFVPYRQYGRTRVSCVVASWENGLKVLNVLKDVVSTNPDDLKTPFFLIPLGAANHTAAIYSINQPIFFYCCYTIHIIANIVNDLVTRMMCNDRNPKNRARNPGSDD